MQPKCYKEYLKHLKNRQEEGNFRKIKNQDKNNNRKDNNKDSLENYPTVSSNINFSDNDYLSLKNDKYIKKKLIQKIRQNPLTVSSSRLLYGGNLFKNLEEKLAIIFKKESVLIFSSGFQLNQSVIATILNKNIVKERIIFCDKENHSSIYEGINFQKNDKLVRYENCNTKQLENLLEEYKFYDNKFILTESVFSMSGKIIDMPQLILLKKKYNCFLFVDDCHATGILGSNGYGLSVDYAKDIDLTMGSFSKSIPSQGGFIACNEILKNLIINECKGFIYSSSLILPALFIAEIFFENINLYEKRRIKLFKNCEYFINKLNKMYKKIDSMDLKECGQLNIFPIIPIIVGDNNKLDQVKQIMEKNNITVSAIKSPTVKKGTERLRISLKSEHTKKNIDKLFLLLKDLI